jgi:DNA polymerase-3 subunit epsilon
MASLFGASKKKLLKKVSEQKDLHPHVLKYLNTIEQIDHKASIYDSRYVVFDTELTGLNIKKDSIVSIGALKMHGRRIGMNEIYYRVVDPKSQLTKQSVVIHGITPTEASECPTIDVLLPEFLDFCANATIIGHFVSIDLAFLNKEMLRLFGFPLQNPSLDTQMIYTWIRKKEENIDAFHDGITEDVELIKLAQKYSIPVTDVHNALSDAFVTAQLFQRFLSSLEKYGVNTLSDLLSIGRPKSI